MIGVSVIFFLVLTVPDMEPATYQEPVESLDKCLAQTRDVLTRMRGPFQGGSVQAGCVVVHPPTMEH